MIPKEIKEIIKPTLLKLKIKQKNILLITYENNSIGDKIYVYHNEYYDNEGIDNLIIDSELPIKYERHSIIYTNDKYKTKNCYSDGDGNYIEPIVLYKEEFICTEFFIHSTANNKIDNRLINFEVIDNL